MKTFTPEEIIHAKQWDLAPEFKIAATGKDDPEHIRHVETAVCRALKETGARIDVVIPDPKVWIVKMPESWQAPQKPVPPADLVETVLDLSGLVKLRPWELPELVRVRQQPTDTKETIRELIYLVLPAILQIHDCDLLESSGSLGKGDCMMLIWTRTSAEKRAAMKEALEILDMTTDTNDPEVAIALKAAVLADLHPQHAKKILEKADEALKLHRARQ